MMCAVSPLSVAYPRKLFFLAGFALSCKLTSPRIKKIEEYAPISSVIFWKFMMRQTSTMNCEVGFVNHSPSATRNGKTGRLWEQAAGCPALRRPRSDFGPAIRFVPRVPPVLRQN